MNKKNYLIGSLLLVCGILITNLTITPRAQTQTEVKSEVKSPVLQTLIAGIQAREDAFSSGSGYFVKQFSSNKQPELLSALDESEVDSARKATPFTSHIFWCQEGFKSREDEKTVSSKNQSYILSSDDSEKIQTWGFGSPTASEFGQDRREEFAIGQQTSYALQIGRRGDENRLSRKLVKFAPTFEGKEQLGGVETYKISLQENTPNGLIETWWIAPERGCLIMKQETRSRVKPSARGILSWRTVNIVDESMQVNANFWVPKKMRSISYATINPARPTEVWQTLYRFSILSIQINQPISPDVFELPLPLGTRVGGKGRDSYFVGGDTSELEKQMKKGEPEANALLSEPLPTIEAKKP